MPSPGPRAWDVGTRGPASIVAAHRPGSNSGSAGLDPDMLDLTEPTELVEEAVGGLPIRDPRDDQPRAGDRRQQRPPRVVRRGDRRGAHDPLEGERRAPATDHAPTAEAGTVESRLERRADRARGALDDDEWPHRWDLRGAGPVSEVAGGR